MARKSTDFTFERLMMSEEGFGLKTATPLQRALFRVSGGAPIGKLWDNPVVQRAFGGVMPPEGVMPKILALTAAIRSAKSKWAAGRVFWASQTVDLSKTSAGDDIRIPIVSTEKDTAGAVFTHLVENLQQKPALRAKVMGKITKDAVTLQHPTGKPIEVKVTALSRYASTLVGRWLAEVVFDEAPRMVGEAEGVRNLTEAIRAVRARILPGGMITLPGSPWAPYGPIYDLVQEHFGKPSEDVCVIRAAGPDMNPDYWNEERVAYVLRTDPRAYRTDCLGEFADSEDAMFASLEVEAAMRKVLDRLPAKDGHFYSAAMDPATRGNAWTLMVLECSGEDEAGRPRYSVALAVQWQGSKSRPLKATQVLAEAAALLKPYRVDTIVTDQHQVDTLSEIADGLGLLLVEHAFNRENRFEMAERVRIMISERRLELPPDPQVRRDLVATRRKVTQNGVTLELPNTGDGRHADYVPTLCLVLQHAPPPPVANDNSVGEDDSLFRSILAAERKNANDAVAAHVARLTG
jgi:hypothetical protein